MMASKADVAVIGGGSIGASVAYNLAKKGIKDVVLVEKGYLGRGSSGRCGAAVRQQWGTKLNCMLSRKSIQLFENLEEELNYDRSIELRQSGYLLLAHDEEQSKQLKKNMELQRELGIPVQELSVKEVEELVPQLNTEGLLSAAFCNEDGHVNPFRVIEAYGEAAEKLGVEIKTFTEVLDIIQSSSGKIEALVTDQGKILTDTVINCTGPYARFIGQMLGLEHPVEPERHQAMITEPVEEMMGPMVICFRDVSYCQQVPHGGFLMGYGNPHEPKGINYSHQWEFMEQMADKAISLFPFISQLRIVRQWAGHYGISPDGQPVLGEVPEVEGYYLALGCGKGFMLSPMIGQLLAERIAGEETSLPIKPYNIERFERGELIVEPAVV